MDKKLYRNFLIILAVALLCFGAFSALLMSNGKNVGRSSQWVEGSNSVILSTEYSAILLERLLNSQRGFLLTHDKQFYDQFKRDKATLSKLLDDLHALAVQKPEFSERIKVMKDMLNEYTMTLERRANGFAPIPPEIDALESFETVDSLRNSIMSLHADIISEEQKTLTERIVRIEKRRDQYFVLLIVGGFICAGILVLQGSVLLHARTHKHTAEQTLKETEARFTLASEGANDGIFDWDIAANTVFYSRPFFSMLGYDRPAHVGTFQEFTELVHPDDLEKMWLHVERYLKGEIFDYSFSFRMKHSSGKMMWINARASAMYDAKGKPYRMVGAHTDITYMKEYQDRLQARREAAEKANRAKTEFLAHMSHEIRTPLTAISGIAEILERKRDELSERVQGLITTLSASTATLKDLINDLLDFAKIESGEMTLESQPYEPAALFDQVYQIMSIQARNKNLEFTFLYPDFVDVQLQGDVLRLRQVLINLIGNAIKFTDSGFVQVISTLDKERQIMSITVKDSGIGIKPEHFDMIFEQFQQADSSASRRIGGTGLGLAISRNLARLMGGDIELHSEIGQGSTFTLSIPAVVATARPVKNKVIKEIANTPMKKTILVAEDYEGNVVVLSFMLEEMGLSFDVVHTGIDAVDAWKSGKYDLILMDVQMPDMDGLSATQAIREIEIGRKMRPIPIIGMTAHALVGDRDKCIQSGMSSYLAKPVVVAELKAKIYNYLNGNGHDDNKQTKTA